MRILVVSLLRIGDVIAAAPAIKAIKDLHPGCTIDALVNASSVSGAQLLTSVDSVISFDRDRIQRACVEADRPFFEAYDLVRDQVEWLNANRYDKIVNFTHNRLSAWLCGLVEAQEKIGLVLDGTGGATFGSSWIRHLNQQADLEDRLSFNHSDIFIGAVGGLKTMSAASFDNLLRESAEGIREADALIGSVNPAGQKIAIQISTSDSKKEWGDDRWCELSAQLLLERPADSLFVLGAPSEITRIRKFCDAVESKVVGRGGQCRDRLRPAIVSLPGAVSLLEEMGLLITGDTSIKHIGSAGSAPVIELALGSSDPFRTGSWKAGDLVVKSGESCVPCGHSEKCHRESHLCSASIPVRLIAALARKVLTAGSSAESVLAESSQAEIIQAARGRCEVFKVDRAEGLSHLVPLHLEFSEELLVERIERSARRVLLEMRDQRFDAMKFGADIREVRVSIEKSFGSALSLDIRHTLGAIEAHIRQAEGAVKSLKAELRQSQSHLESRGGPSAVGDVTRAAIAWRQRLANAPSTRFASEALTTLIDDDRSAPLVRIRKISDALVDLDQRIEVSLKLVRGLEIEFENAVEGAV